MDSNDTTLLGCELDQTDAIDFIRRCESEGVSSSEKITQLIQNFLPTGDNHLLRKTA